MRFISLFSTILVWLTATAAVQAAPPIWQPVAQELHTALSHAGDEYAKGADDKAKQAVLQAYFGIFESRKMEAAMRTTLGASHTYQVESQFGRLRKAIKNKDDIESVRNRIATLNEALMQDAKALDKAGVPAQVFEVNQ